jgi:hypothetical protein
MKRLSVTTLAVLFAAACSNSPGIQLFTAASPSITLGDSTELIFAAESGALLSIDQGVGNVTGKTSVSVSPTATTTYTLTAIKMGRSTTSKTTVTVGQGVPARLTFSGLASEVGVDSGVTLTVTVRNLRGNVVPDFAGTLHIVLTDSAAPPVADVVFTPGMQGTANVSLLFFTAGEQSVIITDATNPALTGSTVTHVNPASAAAYALSPLPVAAVAGDALGMNIQAVDRHGNLVRSYAGTAHVASGDSTDRLPSDGGFVGGARSVSLEFIRAASHFVSVNEVGGTITANSTTVQIAPAATLFAVSLVGSTEAWAGTATNAFVRAQDGFGNAVAGYAGKITFSSSDTAAAKPADVTLTGSEGGTATVAVTFNTVGSQTLTATQSGAAAPTGAATATVRGLVYTDPASGGKVRLIRNAASTNSVMKLDLVSNAILFAVIAAGADTIRNGVFATGMNLPLDATKVSAGSPLIDTTAPAGSTAALNLGTTGTPRAIGAALNATNSVLYSGISQKRSGTPAPPATAPVVLGDASLRPFPGSASFYYSLTLRLVAGAAVGTVFDGANPGSKFHAAVRDRSGTDVFQNADFAIGKLEVR